jgi:dolichol kinase
MLKTAIDKKDFFMKRSISVKTLSGKKASSFRSRLKSELVRKLLHFLIALVPFIAVQNRILALVLLFLGTIFYICIEFLRQKGINVPVLSKITRFAARPREKTGFVAGPVTLGTGAIAVILIFPPEGAGIFAPAYTAIFALALGDGLAGLIGRCFGKLRPHFLRGKSIEGSAACFAAIFALAYAATRRPALAAAAALSGALIEALPLGDADNIALPLGVALVLQALGGTAG